MEKKLHLNRLPNLPPLASESSAATKQTVEMRKRDYSPLPWDSFYDVKTEVQVDGNVFSVYMKGSTGPILMCLHGGGYSALSWAPFALEISRSCSCRCVALDQRAHGDTKTTNDDDLSATTMARDIAEVLSKLCEMESAPIILIGHSMGGALAVHAAADPLLIPTLAGLIVIDVVEGSAMEALTGMKSVLRSRPKSFKSLEYAIEWCVRSGQTRNCDSARVSMGGQIRPATANELLAIKEKQAVTAVKPGAMPEPQPEAYVWRTDLFKSEKFWHGWFEGLSTKFLNCPVPKLLLLAGTDRLDKTLQIGQMQGKFQMQVLREVGHAVHEDSPDKVAQVVSTFLVRNKLSEPLEGFQRVMPVC